MRRFNFRKGVIIMAQKEQIIEDLNRVIGYIKSDGLTNEEKNQLQKIQ